MKRPLTKGVGLTGAALALVGILPAPAHALDEIIRPFMSARSLGMGGVRLTTGLYEENFFNNPARTSANPKFRVTIFDPQIEVNTSAITNLRSITSADGSGGKEAALANTAGTNNHARIQTTMPAVYFPPEKGWGYSFAFAWINNIQSDIALRQNYSADPQVVGDFGPALSMARTFLQNDQGGGNLAVGATAHATYRIASRDEVSLLDLVRGQSLAPSKTSSQGAGIDLDLGTTYTFPKQFDHWEFSVAAAINNVLGGRYDNIAFSPVSDIGTGPLVQPRTFGFGISALSRAFGGGRWHDTHAALEFTDIGNNPNGSLFKTVHLGVESHYLIFIPRFGINQGYWTAGMGFDLRFVTIDAATYGEEMSTNVGYFEDRRYVVRVAFQI